MNFNFENKQPVKKVIKRVPLKNVSNTKPPVASASSTKSITNKKASTDLKSTLKKPAGNSEDTMSSKTVPVLDDDELDEIIKSPPNGVDEASGVETPDYFFDDGESPYHLDPADLKIHFPDEWRIPEKRFVARDPKIKPKIEEGATMGVTRTPTFFSFTAEIRNRIYKYALFPHEGREPRPFFSPRSTWRVKVPARLHVSGDVCEEASRVYYGAMKVAGVDPLDAKMWLSAIGPEARLALGGVSMKWDGEDDDEEGKVLRREEMWKDFKRAWVEVRKEAIEVKGVVRV